MRKFFIILLFALICILAFIYFIASQINAATPSDVRSLHPNEQIINLTTPDGVNIKGSYVAGARANSPAILMLHGNGARRDRFATHFARFNAAGYAVMAIDFRGHGQSQAESKSYGVYESIDARTAFDWLKAKQQGAKTGVIGVSLGGAAALVGAQPLPADAMVLQAVFADIRRAIKSRVNTIVNPYAGAVLEPLLSYQSIIRYGVLPSDISPIDSVKNFRGAIFIMGGENDIYTPPSEIREFQTIADPTGEAWIVADKGHRGASGLRTDEYFARTISFFDQHLKN